MFYKVAANGYKQALPGIKMKTLVYGEKTLFTEFRMERNGQLPRHSHVHEQTGYLVKGKVKLTIGHETFEAGPGDSWCRAHSRFVAILFEKDVDGAFFL